jgi:hypothetical protein
MICKWFVFVRIEDGFKRFLLPDAFDREHGLWKANSTPPAWLSRGRSVRPLR